MTASRIEALRAAAIALLLAAGPALAQGEATGLPQRLGPADEITPPDDTRPLPEPDQAPAPLLRGPVSVGDLGTVEGPVAGTLDETSGGLGPGAWAGMERSLAETILEHAIAATPSATSRLLLRKLLLTAAAPPQGPGIGAFNRLRVRKLLEGGFVDEAAELALLIRSRDPETQRAQADALLYAGNDAEACGEATRARLESADAFWVELRAYCYALGGDMGALELTRAVIEQQGLTDGAFLNLLDAMLAGEKAPGDPIPQPTVIHLRLLVRLQASLPENVVNGLGMPGLLVGAASAATDKQIRIEAAERAFRGGALSARLLAEMLDLFTFRPPDLVGAAALAPSETPLAALARLRAALRAERQAERRAELIVTALRIGENEALLAPVAALFADDAVAIAPQADWDAWAPLMAPALLLAGRPVAAGRWHDILDPNEPGVAASAHYLRLIFALIAPTDIRAVNADQALTELALASTASDATRGTVVRAALALGLYEASGRELPTEARAQLEALLAADFAGRRPAPIIMERLERAALAGRKGEVALGVIDALGAGGARDLPPDIVVRLVRALHTAGIGDGARTLTLEALLTRPSEN